MTAMSRSSKALAALGTVVLSGLAAFSFLVSRGRIHIDLGWGRSTHDLGPIEIEIDAPRQLVYETISGPYLGRTPARMRGKIQVLERSESLVVARHRTSLPLMDAITVEAVGFEPPRRITFRLLQGPVPAVSEEFVLEDENGTTSLVYRGELQADFWALGSWYGGSVVRPVWEGTVAGTLEQVKSTAERRADARKRRP